MIKSKTMSWGRHVTCVGHRAGFRCGDRRERVHLEDLGVDGRNILKRIFREWEGRMDWINLAQDRVKCRALLNEVMNFKES
jgi:hypothetical protein